MYGGTNRPFPLGTASGPLSDVRESQVWPPIASNAAQFSRNVSRSRYEADLTGAAAPSAGFAHPMRTTRSDSGNARGRRTTA
jgi:hypothetical protein